MLALFVRNSKIIQGTGISFAALGTTMHVLNVTNLMSPSLSHTWSAVAIAGFCLTASSQIREILSEQILRARKHKNSFRVITKNERNDVALP